MTLRAFRSDEINIDRIPSCANDAGVTIVRFPCVGEPTRQTYESSRDGLIGAIQDAYDDHEAGDRGVQYAIFVGMADESEELDFLGASLIIQGHDAVCEVTDYAITVVSIYCEDPWSETMIEQAAHKDAE